MQAQKPIIEKLVIYDYPFARTAYYAESKYKTATSKSWCGITREQAEQLPVKGIYEGAAAIRKYWEINFYNLTDIDQKLILAVFPNVLKSDKTPTKSPTELLYRANHTVIFSFGVKCSRCGGEGRYPSKVDDGICHKCGGRGVVLPRLTDKKLAEIAKHFSEAKK